MMMKPSTLSKLFLDFICIHIFFRGCTYVKHKIYLHLVVRNRLARVALCVSSLHNLDLMKSANAAVTSIVIIWIGVLGLRLVLWQCSVVRLNTNVLSTFEFAGESDWR
jgi:hypothetical protein